MADSSIEIKDANDVTVDVDTRTVDTDQHREVVVVGSPTTTAVMELDENGNLPIAVQSVAAGMGFEAEGDRAHDSTDTGQPVKIGGRAYTGAPAPVSAADDRTDAAFTLRGALHVFLADANGVKIHYVEQQSLGSDNASGILALGRRDDALSTLTPTEGQAVGMRVNSRGAQWMVHDGTLIVDGSGVTQPISHAALTELAAAIDTEMQVDIVGALPAGSANIGDVDIASIAAGDNNIGNVDIASMPALPAGSNSIGTVVNKGDVAHDTADSGEPQKVGFQARSSFPTAVADADRVNGTADLFGRQLVSHIDPALAVHKSFNATTAQTGTDVWDPAAGKRIAITSIVIGAYGTTAFRLILWFGDNADTTYTEGTDQAVLKASFAPSASSKPGITYTPAFPIFCTTADRELHVTTDAAGSVDIVVEGYEW